MPDVRVTRADLELVRKHFGYVSEVSGLVALAELVIAAEERGDLDPEGLGCNTDIRAMVGAFDQPRLLGKEERPGE